MSDGFSTTNADSSDNTLLFVYGNPGSGKTNLTSTIPNDQVVLWSLEEKGRKTLRKHEIKYIEINNSKDVFDKQKEAITESNPRWKPIKWIVIDTFYEVMQMIMDSITKGGTRKPVFADWDAMAVEATRFVQNWADSRYNVLFLCHREVQKEEDALGQQRHYIKPKLLGQAVESRNVFPRFADAIIYAYTEQDEEGKQRFKLLLKGSSSVLARGRYADEKVPEVLDHTGRTDTIQYLCDVLNSKANDN